jgi:hypothetical protein
VLEDDTQEIVGCFAIAPHLLERDEAPLKLSTVAHALGLPWP